MGADDAAPAADLPADQAAQPLAPSPDANRINLDGVWVPIRPLTLGHWEQFAPSMQALAEGTLQTQQQVMDALLDVVMAAIQRAQPGFDRQLVKDALDWQQATEAYTKVLAMSSPIGAGEPKGVSQRGASTGPT